MVDKQNPIISGKTFEESTEQKKKKKAIAFEMARTSAKQSNKELNL